MKERGRYSSARRGAPQTVGRTRERAKTLQLIHIAAGQLGLIDAAIPAGDPDRDQLYRDLLEELTGRRSAAELSDAQLALVMARLKALGWQPQTGRHGRRPQMQPGDIRTVAEALLADMGLRWDYAEAILRRNRGLPEDVGVAMQSATGEEWRSVVTALRAERQRRDLHRIDAALAVAGRSRAWLADRLRLPAAWHRQRSHVDAALAGLDAALAAMEAPA
jgi:hypothetical protein